MPCKNWQNNNIISCSYHTHIKGLFFSFVFLLGCEAYFLLPVILFGTTYKATFYYKEPTCSHTLNSTVLLQQRRPEYCYALLSSSQLSHWVTPMHGGDSSPSSSEGDKLCYAWSFIWTITSTLVISTVACTCGYDMLNSLTLFVFLSPSD